MKILINYADAKYKRAQKLNSWTGKHIAKFDEIYSFGPEDIDLEYREAHKDILDEPRGNGLWLWKPYFINRVLEQSQDGDYVFYVDSGAFFLRNAETMIQSFRKDEDIWVSDNPLIESCFTKPECFRLMDCDNEEIKSSNQIQATYVFFRCSEKSRSFVKQWLHLCERKDLMGSAGSLDIEVPVGEGFVAHREDQSILSLLCKMSGIIPHRDPSQRGRYPETFFNHKYAYRVPVHDDIYPSFLFLHKSRKVGIIDCLKVVYRTIRAVYRYRIEN